MVGGAGVGRNEKEDVKSSETSLDESSRDDQNSQKESCVNYFASVLLGEVRKVANDFFKQNRFNDSDCDASTKAMGMLSERNKQG